MIILASIYELGDKPCGTIYSTTASKSMQYNSIVVPRLAFLAPDYNTLVDPHKKRLINNDQYLHGYDIKNSAGKVVRHVPGYCDLLKARWEAQIQPWIFSLKPEDDMTLCCFCPRVTRGPMGTPLVKFCHRQTIYRLLKKHLGPEFQIELR